MRRAALRARARKPAARRAVTTPATPTAPTAMAAKQAERRAWGAAQKGGPALDKVGKVGMDGGFHRVFLSQKFSHFEVTRGPVQTRYTHGQDQQGRHTGPLCQPRNRFVMFIRTRMSMWHVGCRMCVRAARATAHRSPLDRLKRPPAITTAYALAHVLARRPSVRADVSVSLR